MEILETDKWLRRKWIAAGFATSAELARALGTTVAAVRGWEDGRRPGWGYIQAIARAISAEPGEAVVHLWREQPGQTCPCGCGGLKVLPTRRNAYSLDISLLCQRCSKPRTYRWNGLVGARLIHRPLCPGCSHVKPRLTMTCIGYDDHGVTRRAKRCTGTLDLRPSDIAELQKPGDGVGVKWGRGLYDIANSQTKFVDVEAGTYRCGRCALGARGIAVMEQRIKAITPERIRSGSQRREVLSDIAAVLNRRFMRSSLTGSRRAKEKLHRDGVPEHVRLARHKGRIVKAWTDDQQKPWRAAGICVACGMLTLTNVKASGRWHRACLDEWYRSPLGRGYQARGASKGPIPLPSRPRGRPPSPKGLLRAFGWAVQHYIGAKSYRDIAQRAGVAAQSVNEQVDRVASLLPPPKLIREPERRAVEYLLLARAELT